MDHKIEDKNICLNCEERLADIAVMDDLKEEERNLLNRPKRVFTFSIPIKNGR